MTPYRAFFFVSTCTAHSDLDKKKLFLRASVARLWFEHVSDRQYHEVSHLEKLPLRATRSGKYQFRLTLMQFFLSFAILFPKSFQNSASGLFQIHFWSKQFYFRPILGPLLFQIVLIQGHVNPASGLFQIFKIHFKMFIRVLDTTFNLIINDIVALAKRLHLKILN